MVVVSDFWDSTQDVPLVLGTIFLLTTAVLWTIYNLLSRTDIPHIRGILEIPGALPVTGHLTQLGDDHASTCETWWRQYGQSVFQIRLGNTRVVVVNSFEDCKNILIKNTKGLIDRPKLYTFHGLISSTQGFTIGSSPWDESCRNKRKAASTTLSKAMMKNYHNIFDLESYCIVRDLLRDTKNGALEVKFRPYIQRYALNTTLTLCYGIRMDEVYDDLLREILQYARSKELRERRDKYLNELLGKGIKYQDRAYEEIKKRYPDIATAWADNFEKEDVPYLNAVVKEAGRYYTVSNMSLPRKTMSDVRWGDAVIPKNTMVLINAQAGNHDTDHWGPDASTFNPERWLEPPQLPSSLHVEKIFSSTLHLSFVAGSRSCPGATIASKLMYAALFRLLSLYRIEASKTDPPNTDYVDYNLMKSALVAIPRDFKIKLSPRDGTGDLARKVTKVGQERTKEFYKE
ncbi:hypothetical protein E8E12_003462 [Didymella heteroderae]|uniref:Cytochrome P450 n=1 Tax=Didymella heteroderae TaxID=1769908 RepID=A0A9P5C2L1_9PLEO|nr:hypothetical protein E8E12_003462 [Didymella heteroderae]